MSKQWFLDKNWSLGEIDARARSFCVACGNVRAVAGHQGLPSKDACAISKKDIFLMSRHLRYTVELRTVDVTALPILCG